jgi:Protein of unknown function (DUF3592)
MIRRMLAQTHVGWSYPATWPWFFCLWLVFLVFTLARKAWQRFQRNRAVAWPSCPGRVDSAYVNQKQSSWAAQPRQGYRAGLLYSYSAEGRKETGYYEQEFPSKEEAANYVRELEGKPLTVSYNPQKPSISAVTPQALTTLLSLRPPAAFQPAVENVPSWARLLLWPFTALSAIGLILSIWIHIAALAGRVVAPEQWLWMLDVGVVIVFVPAIFVAQRRVGSTQRKDFWKVVLRGSPEWIRFLVYILLGYAVMNFIIVAPQAPKGRSTGGTPVTSWRLLSGHWMVFYSASLAILCAAVAASDKQRAAGSPVRFNPRQP